MNLFLISGKAGSGKNEVSLIIKESLDKTIITSFSKYIKLFALELTDWDGRDFDKPRQFLQEMGDKLRAISEDFLTKRVFEDIEVYKQEGFKNVIVSDVRLEHELNYFKSKKDLNVITIRVNCEKGYRDLKDIEKKHHTETDLDSYDNFDFVINNNFDDKLKEEVLNILKGMK